jgi:hypothetical protein
MKNKNDTVTHYRSGHSNLCPVIVWAKIVQRIWSYQITTTSTPVNTFMDQKGNIHHITGTQLLKQI